MRRFLAAAVVVAVAATGAFAQQTQQRPSKDAMAFAKKAAAANTFEIKSSELARDRASSSDVKAFATQMIADHTKLGENLKAALQAADITLGPDKAADAKRKAALARLQNARGPAFDKAYLSAQLAGHKEAVSLLRKYAKTGRTPQLKEFAQTTLPVVERHLTEAKDLMSQAVAAGKGRTGTGSRAIGPPAELRPR